MKAKIFGFVTLIIINMASSQPFLSSESQNLKLEENTENLHQKTENLMFLASNIPDLSSCSKGWAGGYFIQNESFLRYIDFTGRQSPGIGEILYDEYGKTWRVKLCWSKDNVISRDRCFQAVLRDNILYWNNNTQWKRNC